jgi:hypothetical protein
MDGKSKPSILPYICIVLILYMAKPEKHLFIQEDITLLTETERLKKDIYRPDIEKLQLFTKMLRTNQLFKKAIIRHK